MARKKRRKKAAHKTGAKTKIASAIKLLQAAKKHC